MKTAEKRPEVRAAMLAKLVEKYTPSLVLAAATQEGKDVTPLLAQKFEAGCAVDVMNIVQMVISMYYLPGIRRKCVE